MVVLQVFAIFTANSKDTQTVRVDFDVSLGLNQISHDVIVFMYILQLTYVYTIYLHVYMTLELIQNFIIYLSIKLDAMENVYTRKFIRREVVNAFYGCDFVREIHKIYI